MEWLKNLKLDSEDWTEVSEPAAETAAVVSKSGLAGRSHRIKGFSAFYVDSSGTPIAQPFKATLTWGSKKIVFATDRGIIEEVFLYSLNIGEETAFTLTVDAPPAGSGMSARLYVWGITR